ncbi:MAG: M23 family metallopeptidase [Chitinophagaceae bacterium]
MRLFHQKYSLLAPRILCTFIFLPLQLFAQKKDSLRLACLLDNVTVHAPEKPAINLGQTEPKIILSSASDTVVKACADVVISTVQRDEEGKWEIVFNHKNYWFWLSGLTKVVVRKDQRIKTGETIGHLETGKKIELLLYDFETPLDPKKYMNCGKSQ